LPSTSASRINSATACTQLGQRSTVSKSTCHWYDGNCEGTGPPASGAWSPHHRSSGSPWPRRCEPGGKSDQPLAPVTSVNSSAPSRPPTGSTWPNDSVARQPRRALLVNLLERGLGPCSLRKALMILGALVAPSRISTHESCDWLRRSVAAPFRRTTHVELKRRNKYPKYPRFTSQARGL
jgi:hypothetical protein